MNGELRQHGLANEMTMPIPEIIAFVSSIFTLEPGDLIFTGTPAGVGEVFPGDLLHASLLGHAELRVTVIDENTGVLETEDEEGAGAGEAPSAHAH